MNTATNMFKIQNKVDVQANHNDKGLGANIVDGARDSENAGLDPFALLFLAIILMVAMD